jgi:hypothetical protein
LSGSRIGSRSKKYRDDRVSSNSNSYVADNRSPTDSGIGLVLAQITALRSHHPDACSANATRHGTPMRFFAGSRDPLRSSGSRPVAASWPAVSLNVGWARFGPPV